MTRLYKQTARSTEADATDKQAGSRPDVDDLLYRLDLQRQIAPGSERTFGQWAIQALLDDEDDIATEASKQGTRPLPAAAVYSSSPLMMNTIFAHGVGIVSPTPHGSDTTEQAIRPSSNARIADENSNTFSNRFTARSLASR